MAVGYAVIDGLHSLDHVHQGRGLPPAIYVVGLVGFAIAVVVAVLAGRTHPAAAISAAVYGFVNAVGLVVIHLLPRWNSYISDPYSKVRDLDFLSWTIVYAQLICALALAGVGTYIMVRRGRVMGPLPEEPSAEPQPEPA